MNETGYEDGNVQEVQHMGRIYYYKPRYEIRLLKEGCYEIRLLKEGHQTYLFDAASFGDTDNQSNQQTASRTLGILEEHSYLDPQQYARHG